MRYLYEPSVICRHRRFLYETVYDSQRGSSKIFKRVRRRQNILALSLYIIVESRQDAPGRVSNLRDTDVLLDVHDSVDVLRPKFTVVGLNDKDLVLLSSRLRHLHPSQHPQ